MGLGNARKLRGIEPSGAGEARAGGDRPRLPRQRPAQPLGDRGDEALLGPEQHVVRQVSAHRVLEQPLALPPPYPLAEGQLGGKFDQPVIEQRLARLQAHVHAGAIDLGQDVAGQPELEIGILRPVEAAARRGRAHRAHEGVFGAIAVEPPGEAVGIEARAHLRRHDAHGTRISLCPVAGEREQGRLGPERARRPVGLGPGGTERAEHRAAQRAGQDRARLLLTGVKDLPPIAGKRLVRPVAREGDRHVLARELAHAPGRQGGRIGKGFVEHRRDPVRRRKIVGIDRAGVVIGPEQPGDLFRVSRLVQLGHVEPDRTGADRVAARFRHQRDDRGRIDPAGKKRAQRHVGHHARSHRLAHVVQQFGRKVGRAAAAPMAEIDIPPLHRRRGRRLVAQDLVVPGRELADAIQDRTVIGDVAPGKIIVDRQRIDLAPQERMGQQALELGSESHAAIAELRGEKGFHPQAVARQHEFPAPGVVEREREHAVQARKALDAPARPGGQDHLGIAIGAELGALGLQLAAKLPEIVDLAIEHDRRTAIGRMHRLGRAGDVDDRQPAVAQPDPRAGPDARPVWSAMGERVRHARDALGIDRLGGAAMENPGDAAHGPALIAGRPRGPSTRRVRPSPRRSGRSPPRFHRRASLPRTGSGLPSAAAAAGAGWPSPPA